MPGDYYDKEDRMPPIDITIGKEGAREYLKVSYPIRYGTYQRRLIPLLR
jgi:hypothetical protein